MSDIKQIGMYWEADENGFIESIFSVNNIHSDNKKLAKYFVSKAIEYYTDNIHSLYVRGSILTNPELQSDFDKDFIVVLYENDNWNNFVERYDNFISTLDSNINFDISLYSTNNFVLDRKFNSLCLYGNDVSVRKVNIKNLVNDTYTASNKYNILKTILLNTKESVDLNDNLRRDCKKIIRLAMLSVSLKINKYTKDLYYCCKFYEECYPQYGKQMWDVLELYLNPNKYDKLILYTAIDALLSGE